MNEESGGASVLFRVASAPAVGGGHVSRCLAVAAALKDKAPILMVLDPGADTAAARCAEIGVPATDRRPEDGIRLGACVLDGYEFTASEVAYYGSLAPLVVMDDFGIPPAGASLAINAAPGQSGTATSGVPALLGPRYAPISPRFAVMRQRPVPPAVRSVMITLGRTEAHAAAERALDAVEAARGTDFDPEVVLVLPGSDRMPESLSRKIDAHSLGQITLVEAIADMPAALAETDLVIGAGGVSLLERMAAGVPSVSIVLAENQRASIVGAVELGATITCDENDDPVLATDALSCAISKLARDADWRSAMAAAGRAAVDGNGAQRIADAIFELAQADRREAASV